MILLRLLFYYGIERNYINIFDFNWDENEVENTIISEYNWEIDPGTNTTRG